MSNFGKIRGGHKAQVTKLIDLSETMLNSEDLDIEKLQSVKHELCKQKENIDYYNDKILETLSDETQICYLTAKL